MRPVAPMLALALVLLSACSAAQPGQEADRPVLRVSAAASLKQPLTAYAKEFGPAKVRLSFAGSDELAAQIRRGARPDVFLAANLDLPRRLAREGLLSTARPIAANRLVLAVPAAGGRVRALADLERPGVRIAAGAPGVPVGAYTREVLRRLGPGPSRAILDNVRSEEPDVAGVVGKLSQRVVDAGFVYASDVRASGGRLRAIELPAGLRPDVVYGAGVVRDTRVPRAAVPFLEGLLDGSGAEALRAAGFAPPPGFTPPPGR